MSLLPPISTYGTPMHSQTTSPVTDKPHAHRPAKLQMVPASSPIASVRASMHHGSDPMHSGSFRKSWLQSSCTLALHASYSVRLAVLASPLACMQAWLTNSLPFCSLPYQHTFESSAGFICTTHSTRPADRLPNQRSMTKPQQTCRDSTSSPRDQSSSGSSFHATSNSTDFFFFPHALPTSRDISRHGQQFTSSK